MKNVIWIITVVLVTVGFFGMLEAETELQAIRSYIMFWSMAAASFVILALGD